MIILAAVAAATTLQVAVPEDRGVKGGRTIELNVVVLPAQGPRKREPLFILQGGPGQAATALADFYAQTFAGIRAERDIVLVDQRGTGQSHPLTCDLTAGDELFPPDAVAACRDRLARDADLLRYTTADAVADLDAVRRRLGYDTINLYGTSYGVRMVTEYARRQPSRVRSAIVKGVLSPGLRYTVDPALDTERSLERLAGVAPGFRADLDAVLKQLPRDGVTRETFGVVLRAMLHSTPSMAKLPKMMHGAAAGDLAPFAAFWKQYRESISHELALGMYFSVACAEDAWRVSDAEAKRLTGGTVAGDYWHRQLVRACALWPKQEPHRDVARPFRSRVPMLIVSGAFDPVTPPRWGEDLRKTFVNSRHVVVGNGSHSFAGMAGCIDVMMSAFIAAPDPGKVDASCAAKIALPKLDE
jgi:pimeloyl-ACP methyl ester carboxylesterase